MKKIQLQDTAQWAELEKQQKQEIMAKPLKTQKDVMPQKTMATFAKPGTRTYYERCREE